ncbi:MAG TPA: hypothetical protein VF222_04290 [Nitrososphaeraceae archaeon]
MAIDNFIQKSSGISSSLPPLMATKIKEILKKDNKDDTIGIYSKENVKIFDILVNSKREICIACVSLDQIFSFNYIEVFKSILKNSIKLKILLCDPHSDLLNHIKYLTVFPNIYESLTSCLSKLCNMKIVSLSTKELSNVEIRIYKTILPHNLIIIDRDIHGSGIILVEPYLFGIKSQNRKIYQIYKRKNQEIFDLHFKSFLKLWETSPEYSCEWEEL